MIIPKFDKNFLPDGYVRRNGEYEGMLCRKEYLDLPPEQKHSICNGIGASTGLSKHLPSTIYLLDCTESGNTHDYDYFRGGTDKDRETADLVFLHNLRIQIKKGSWWMRWLRNRRARIYYVTLWAVGWMHFNYIKGND